MFVCAFTCADGTVESFRHSSTLTQCVYLCSLETEWLELAWFNQRRVFLFLPEMEINQLLEFQSTCESSCVCAHLLPPPLPVMAAAAAVAMLMHIFSSTSARFMFIIPPPLALKIELNVSFH